MVNVWQKLLIALLLLFDQRLTKSVDCIIAIGWSTSDKNCWLHYCYWVINLWKNCWLHYCYWVINVWQKLLIALLPLGDQRLSKTVNCIIAIGRSASEKTVDCIIVIGWSTSDKNCLLHYWYWVVNVWSTSSSLLRIEYLKPVRCNALIRIFP